MEITIRVETGLMCSQDESIGFVLRLTWNLFAYWGDGASVIHLFLGVLIITNDESKRPFVAVSTTISMVTYSNYGIPIDLLRDERKKIPSVIVGADNSLFCLHFVNCFRRR